MANSASLFLQDSKMPYLQESKPQLTPEGMTALRQGSLTSNNEETPWLKTNEGKATIAGAAEGMKSGSLSNTLTSAGINNMLAAGGITAAGAGLAGAGIILAANEQGNAIDYANKKMIADEQQRSHNAKVAGLYKMMSQNYGMV